MQPILSDKRFAWGMHLAALSCVALKLSPLFALAYGCDDDIAVAVSRSARGGVFEAAWMAAIGWGRFYEVVAHPIAQLSFLFNDLTVANGFRAFATGGVFLAMWIFVRTLTRSPATASFATVMATVALYTGPNYNPYHCYPMWFQPPLTLSFLSWSVFLVAIRRHSISLRVSSAAIQFAAMLFYEPFILFGLGHFLLFLWEKREENGMFNVSAWVKSFVAVLPVFLASIAYAIIFFVFQRMHPSEYPGSQASIPSLTVYLKTLWLLTGPTWQFTSRTFSGTAEGLKLAKSLPIYAYIAVFSLLVTATTWITLGKVKPSPTHKRIALLAALGAVIFIFVPNAIYGLAKSYRDKAAQGMIEPYIGNFYSDFFLGLLFTALAVAVMASSSRSVRRVGRVIFCVLVFTFCVNASEVTSRYARGWWKDRLMWNSADLYVYYLLSHPEEKPDAIDAPEFFRGAGVVIHESYDYWTHHFRLRGVPVQVIDPRKALPSPLPTKIVHMEWVYPLGRQPMVALGVPRSMDKSSLSRTLQILNKKNTKVPELEVAVVDAESSDQVVCTNAKVEYSIDRKWVYLKLDGSDVHHCEIQGTGVFNLGTIAKREERAIILSE